MKILGVMTGTSCDGLDVACAEFGGGTWNSLWTKSASYPTALRKRVLAAQLPNAKLSLKEWGELHRDLGIWIAGVVKRFLQSREQPDAIACHGQTVAHFPAPEKEGFTIQLADPARIAEATGLTVVSNFRDGDMAAGGEGAPLAPRFHRLLAGGQSGISIHNLGGISNLTYVGGPSLVLAFDTGPANLWIDAATELVTRGKMKFDRDGKIARQHAPDLNSVERALADPFFSRKPPKSTGRDEFPFEKLLKLTRARDGSLVATATAITVESIARAYGDFIVKKKLRLAAIYFSGGGARNKFLMDRLRARLSGIRINALDELGVNARYVEANAFAYFGFLALQSCPLGGAWTGVSGWAPAAHIIPGRNWPQIVRRLAAGAD
jgi:anhydro-N-acetylmuramic acid kinase